MSPNPWYFAPQDRAIARKAAIMTWGPGVLIPRPVRWLIVILGWLASEVLLAWLLPDGWPFSVYALCGAPIGCIAAMIGLRWSDVPRWHRGGYLS